MPASAPARLTLVSPDGSRILANVATGDDHPPFVLVQNSMTRLKQ